MLDSNPVGLNTLVEHWMDTFQVNLDLELQENLIVEEALEILCVYADHPEPSVEACKELLKESADLLFTMIGYSVIKQRLGTDRPISEWAATLITPVIELQVQLVLLDKVAIDALLTEAFLRVVASNMTKLGDDGLPIKNEAGKIMKGPNYKEPDLTDLAEKLFELV